MKIVSVISLIINGVRDLFASDVQIRLGIKGKHTITADAGNVFMMKAPQATHCSMI